MIQNDDLVCRSYGLYSMQQNLEGNNKRFKTKSEKFLKAQKE